ncbi:MAG: glycosyltransferase family 2 protein [Pseudomonadota bacterium]
MSSITAIVPTYNRAAFLKETLQALQKQTRPVDEIIVWDDGSIDGTAEVAHAFGTSIRYFRGENGGKSRALNAAMEQANGELIWICDDDDIALPDAAETLSDLLASKPEAGIAGGGYRRFRGGPDGAREEQGPGYWPDLALGTPIRHILEDIFLFQNAMLARRSLYDRAGPFREDLPRSIDYEMLVRLGTLAPIEVTDRAIFLQRKHDGDRGPASARHAADRSDEVWKSADRAIFSEFRSQIPVSFYEGMFEAGDARFVRRAALLQRGAVYARRTDWDAAILDFAAASEAAPDAPLCPLEVAICRRAVSGKHGIGSLTDAGSRRALARLARSSAAGTGIARGVARGLAWRAKAAFRTGQLAASTGIVTLALTLLTSGRETRGPAPLIKERRDIPAAAYLSSWT